MGTSKPNVADATTAATTIDAITELLAPHAVTEADQLAGKLLHVAGRGQSLVPPIQYDEFDGEQVRGRVTFSRFYLGGGGAVHGGVVPLLFDEVFGSLAGAEGRPRSRTAYLHTNYRIVTPLDRELQLAAKIDRIEGRKVFMTGTLSDGTDLLCDSECLFVTLKPGQP